jgi:MYXO-CTERM domain-containing protein
MTRAHTILGAFAAASLAGIASADINFTFENFTATGAQFFQYADGDNDVLDGVLEGASGDFVLNSGANFTWADDLCVLVANDDLTDLLVQIGGYSTFGATYRYTWPTGASGDPGTAAGGVALSGEAIDVTGYRLWFGNGYASGGEGDWTGSIDLTGSELSMVPAPGALALLGLAGVAARRRRN